MNNKNTCIFPICGGGGVERKWKVFRSRFKIHKKQLLLILCTFIFFIFNTHYIKGQNLSFSLSHDSIEIGSWITVTNSSDQLQQGLFFQWGFLGADFIIFSDSAYILQQGVVLIQDTQFVFKAGLNSYQPWDTLIISLAVVNTNGDTIVDALALLSPLGWRTWPANCHDIQIGPCDDNFVCNGSFNWINSPALGPQDLHRAEPWVGMLAEVFHSASTNPNFSTPQNQFGYHYPLNGNGYGGFHTSWQQSCLGLANQECISTPLKYPMFPGQAYSVSFHALLANASNKATPLVAFIEEFGQVLPSYGADLQLLMSVFPSGLVTNNQGYITDMNNWVKCEGTFLPTLALPTSPPNLIIGAPDNFSYVNVQGGGTNWDYLAYYYIDSVEVRPEPAYVDLRLNYTVDCYGVSVSAINPENVVAYQWCVNGVPVPGETNPTAILYPTTNTVECIVTNYHGCETTYILELENFACSDADFVLINPLASDIIANILNGASSWTTNDEIYIMGNFTLDVDFSFTSCPNIKLGRDAKIVLEPDIAFTITNCTIMSCDPECFFWDGIYATDANSRIEITESYISHAKRAVYSRNNPELYIDGNEFSYNLVGIHITNHQRYCLAEDPPGQPPVPASADIRNNHFFGELHNYTVLIYDYLPGFVGMEWGIRVDSVDLLTIGPNNTFEDLSCGIHINTGNVLIEENHFLNIKHHTTLTSTPDPWGYMTINNLFREGAIIANKKVDYAVSSLPMPPPPEYCVPPILTINNNDFSDCHMGVYVFGHSTTIDENQFENITYNSLRGNQLPSALISNNQHFYNNTGPLHPNNNTFNYEYIIAQPKKSMGGYNIDISNNTIYTYKSGINLINTTSTGLSQVNPKRWVDVHDNEIYLNDVGEDPFLQGIRLQGADRSRVFRNIIENIDQNNYPTSQTPMANLQGILVSQTTDAKVRDNYSILKFGKGINNIGYNVGTQFWCNNLYSNYFGFHAEPYGMGQNTSLSNQLVTGEENRNCFFNNIDLWINNQSAAIEWYYTGSLNPPGNECTPSNYYYYNITPQIGASLAELCAPLPDNWLDPQSREDLFGAIARDEDTLYGALQEEFEWYARDHLFRSLYGDSLLMNMGVSEDSIYMHFYNFFSNSNIASFAEIEYLIDHYDIEQALWDNNNIVTQTLIEFNLQRVNEILLESWAQGFEVDSIQSSILQAIALLTPYVGGDAVFTARVMLDIDPFNHGLPYRKSNENQLKSELQALIYPNPTSGSLTVEFAEPVEKTDGTFEIYDIQGRKVLCYNIDNSGVIEHFDVSKLKNGIYLVRIIMNNGQQFSKKLIKSH